MNVEAVVALCELPVSMLGDVECTREEAQTALELIRTERRVLLDRQEELVDRLEEIVRGDG